MRWQRILLVLGSTFLLVACNNEAGAMKRIAASGTSCSPDKVDVRDATSQYKGRLKANYEVFDVNVCGGGWRTYCFLRVANTASEGLDACLTE